MDYSLDLLYIVEWYIDGYSLRRRTFDNAANLDAQSLCPSTAIATHNILFGHHKTYTSKYYIVEWCV